MKISSSWTFNAGLLKNIERNPANINFWFPSFKPFNLPNNEYEWYKSHVDETSLKKAETLKRQDGSWFTDYDLHLERKDARGHWVEILKRTSVVSNDELIEFKASETGIYRYRIRKFNKNNFSNSVDDLIAITHVVSDENK